MRKRINKWARMRSGSRRKTRAISPFMTRKPRLMSASSLYREITSAAERSSTLVTTASLLSKSSAFRIASQSMLL